MNNKKGLSSAIAIVITIVVLLIIALAVIGVSTGAIGKLGTTISKTPSGEDISGTVCASLITEYACNTNPSCEWDSENEKCVPKE